MNTNVQTHTYASMEITRNIEEEPGTGDGRKRNLASFAMFFFFPSPPFNQEDILMYYLWY